MPFPPLFFVQGILRVCFAGALMLMALSGANLFAQETPRRMEFRGQILLPAGTVPPRRWITVNLLAVGTPYYSRATAQRDGRFRFKKLAAGTYTLLITIPRSGEIARTVEITPSFADAKGRVARRFEFTAEQLTQLLRPEVRGTVSVRELQVPYNARREFQKAQGRLRRKDADGAVEHLQKALEKAPEFLEAINSLGIIHYQRRQYDEAEQYFRRALEIEPEAPEPLLNLGGVLLTRGKAEEAVQVNQRAQEALPQDPLASAQLGFSYYLTNDHPLAIMYLDRTKELDPAHFTSPQLTLARVFLRLDQHEEAIAEIDEFLRLRPDSPDAAQARELRQRALRAGESERMRNGAEN